LGKASKAFRRFFPKYIYALAVTPFLFTAGVLSRRHRFLIFQIAKHFGMRMPTEEERLPVLPLSTILESNLDFTLLEPLADGGNVSTLELMVIASLASEEIVTLVATASGWTVGDVRPLTRLNVTAIAEEARKEELPFEGHVPDAVRAADMSAAGMHSFEHLIGIFEGSSPAEAEFLTGTKTEAKFLSTYDPARAEALAAILAKNQTWQCPTLVWERGGNLIDVTDYSKDPRAKYVPAYWKDVTWKKMSEDVKASFGTDDLATRRKFLDKELEVVQMMHKAGVPFLAGTDTPPGVYIFPGFSLHEELQRFVAAGFTPLEALQTATLNPARFFGMEDQLGTVAMGKMADLVLLDANPLADIANTQKIAAVIVNGRYFSRNDLQKMLQKAEESAKKQPTKPGALGNF
jgi:imidazolonepropionase-like amidohydrolase